MTDWAAFAGITAAVLVLLLLLARASQTVVSAGSDEPTGTASAEPVETGELRTVRYGPEPPEPREESYPTKLLLVNVAFSQGVFAALLLAGAWLTAVPPSAFGLSGPLAPAVALGLGFGVALSLANTGAGALAEAFGHAPSEELRELLAPESLGGWLLLLGVVLPVIAGFEELLFRGALIGAMSVGFELSPWLLAVLSSVAFALGHGAQGPIGITVTGTLGFVLAVGYILTGSLVVVVVAHYLVNAVEFLVYEGLGVEVPFKS
ncbi:CPBP family intramembrane glutamic endopeptidase [Natronomonas sp. EA1]|uniref:CPBP family intramembrane glutamic endopeptidase n=1 Tax=Natronomonas sp. EA1 TaxID=3421655 RepID=UPI003EBF721E